MGVDDAGQPVQLHQGVLKRRRGQQQLRGRRQPGHERLGRLVPLLVDVPKPVRFVDDRQVPRHGRHGVLVLGREVVRADDDLIADVERVGLALGLKSSPCPALHDHGGQEELLPQLLLPLLAQRGRNHDEDVPTSLGPPLRDDQCGLDGLPEADLVREDDALRQRRTQGEQGGVHLMWIEVHAGVGDRTRQVLDRVRRALHRQRVCPILCVVRRGHVSDSSSRSRSNSPPASSHAIRVSLLIRH